MNIKLDVDITPEEMRRLMGLPDMESFHQEILDKIRERMEAGMEGYDPLNLFQPYLYGSVAGMDAFQKMMGAMMGGYTGSSDDRKKD